ncbi:MAG TPA: hypothetical protein DEA05_05035 [Rhodobacteraceae bacterium]|jgi:hypothetical protein|nr:hypothetical protein [Paracoccaceae bacterium]
MKQLALCLALALTTAAGAVSAQDATCYADYKAKQDDPLRLHYGVIELTQGCAPEQARAEIAARLAPAGWTLLNVLGVFGPEGLAEREADAGAFFLRF